MRGCVPRCGRSWRRLPISAAMHVLRNALDYVPRRVDDDCLQKLRWLYDRRDLAEARRKGKPVDVKQVAQELGVRYVLEGSVRKAGNRVRITGQLIDSWSE